MERYNRSYKEECLLYDHPTTLEETIDKTMSYWRHYLYERPHQGRSCGNRPPMVAFPELPPRPPVPERVDPDRWIAKVAGQQFVRRVRKDTSISVDDDRYYVSRESIGRELTIGVESATKALVARYEGAEIKRWPLKNAGFPSMAFDAYVEWIAEQARTERMRAHHTSIGGGPTQLSLSF